MLILFDGETYIVGFITPVEDTMLKVVSHLYCRPILSILGRFLNYNLSVMVSHDNSTFDDPKHES